MNITRASLVVDNYKTTRFRKLAKIDPDGDQAKPYTDRIDSASGRTL